MLEIKTLKQGLIDQNVPEDALSELTNHTESKVRPAIDDIASDILNKYEDKLDADRKNELETELKHSLLKLTDRIDRGFQIELRVSEPASEEENSEETPERSAIRHEIIEATSKLRLQHSGENPILFLTMGSGDSTENNDEE